MVTKGRLEFANFICRFGEDRVLLDFVEEIIIPAFVSVELERLTATSKYFFHDVQIVQLGTRSNPIIGIAGRFIKDMTLSREQVFDPRNRRLISDRREIQSAPSSVFLLILNNHKLLFLRETQQAPGLVSFETTIKYFIQQKHNEFVESLYQANQEASVSRRSLLEQYPRPTIEIVALASGATLEEFIGRFNILENIKIKLLATNNEIDNNEFFDGIRVGQRHVDIVQSGCGNLLRFVGQHTRFIGRYRSASSRSKIQHRLKSSLCCLRKCIG